MKNSSEPNQEMVTVFLQKQDTLKRKSPPVVSPEGKSSSTTTTTKRRTKKHKAKSKSTPEDYLPAPKNGSEYCLGEAVKYLKEILEKEPVGITANKLVVTMLKLRYIPQSSKSTVFNTFKKSKQGVIIPEDAPFDGPGRKPIMTEQDVIPVGPSCKTNEQDDQPKVAY